MYTQRDARIITDGVPRYTRDLDAGIDVVTPPTVEPHTPQQMLDHLRVVSPDEATQVIEKYKLARAMVEGWTGEALCSQELKLTLGGFPLYIELPRQPAQGLTSIVYLDTSGGTVTMQASQYRFIKAGGVGRIWPAYGTCWPMTYPVADAVTVQWTAGYASTDGDPTNLVPANAKAAILLLLGHLWENREGTSDRPVAEIPYGVKNLLGIG